MTGLPVIFFVDPTGLEPVTSALQMRRSTTKLRAHKISPTPA
jgi:hypothetical protein